MIPPQAKDWHGVWVAPLQTWVVPPPQAPLAPLDPHPEHVWPMVMVLVRQESAQALGWVEQPETALHVGLQQPEPVHAVVVAEHVHSSQTSPVPLHRRVQVAG